MGNTYLPANFLISTLLIYIIYFLEYIYKMKSNKKSLTEGFIALIFIITIISQVSISGNIKSMNNGQKININDEISTIKPVSSAQWVNTSIVIDNTLNINSTHLGNWTWAKNQPWCDGEGTIETPYVIENMTFNIPSGVNGLTIMNSNNIFFTIQNCIFNNADGANSGLALDQSSNGTIFNNRFLSNGFGVRLYDYCDNNTIAYNYVNDSHYNGIYIQNECNLNLILNNNVTNSNVEFNLGWHGRGIYIRGNSDNNTIANNFCSYNRQIGIVIYDGCDNTIIRNNTVEYNKNGIYVWNNCQYNIIQNNTARYNGIVSTFPYGSGIVVSQNSNSNNVTNNTAYYNRYSGIVVSQSHYNYVINNTANSNSRFNSYCSGIYLFEARYNNIKNNIIEDNEYHGMYIREMSRNNTISNNSISNSIHGLDLEESSNNTIEYNEISDCSYYGLYFRRENNENRILNNTFSNVESGIYLSSSQNNHFINLRLINVQRNGIYIKSSSFYNDFSEIVITGITEYGVYCENSAINNSFSGISMEGGGFGIFGSKNTTIEEDCTVNGKKVLTYNDDSSLTIDGDIDSDVGQIILTNCQNSIVSNYELSSASIGITLIDCFNIELSENLLDDHYGYGIYVFNCNNTVLSNNEVYNSINGIYAYNCNDTRILNNQIFSNLVGIKISGRYVYVDIDDEPVVDLSPFTRNISISNNNISDNVDVGISGDCFILSEISSNRIENNGESGIIIETVLNTTISKNKIINNTDYGIYFENSFNNTITKNFIKDTISGLYLQYSNQTLVENNGIKNCTDTGIYLDEESGENILYKNEFENNTLHAYDDGDENTWYHGNIGNYWENYTGSDTNADGIGETPYNFIGGNAQSSDLYPIVEFYSSIGFFMYLTAFPDDLSFNISDSGKLISWMVYSNRILSERTYKILKNGTEIYSGTWDSETYISLNFDDLALEKGSYNFTLIVSDGRGKEIEDSVIITMLEDIPGDNFWWVIPLILAVLAVSGFAGLKVLQKRDPDKYEKLTSKSRELYLASISKSKELISKVKNRDPTKISVEKSQTDEKIQSEDTKSKEIKEIENKKVITEEKDSKIDPQSNVEVKSKKSTKKKTTKKKSTKKKTTKKKSTKKKSTKKKSTKKKTSKKKTSTKK